MKWTLWQKGISKHTLRYVLNIKLHKHFLQRFLFWAHSIEGVNAISVNEDVSLFYSQIWVLGCMQGAGKWWAALVFQTPPPPNVSWNWHWSLCPLVTSSSLCPLQLHHYFETLTMKKLYLKIHSLYQKIPALSWPRKKKNCCESLLIQ